MELTYEANLPLLRKLAIMLAVTGLGGDSFDGAPDVSVSEASEDFGGSFEEGARKSDEQIEKEAEEILDLHGNSILRLALSYLHNKEDAEDILQETLIKFVTVSIDYNNVRDTLELNEEIAGQVQEDLDSGEEYKAIWDAVLALPMHQREAIHLFYQEGYQTAEIAQITGRREATVRSDLKRARDKLRELLKEADDFE